MKLGRLSVGDKFYWKSKKYQVFITLKNKTLTAYKVCCSDYPQPDGVYYMPSGRIVKPIIRIAAKAIQPVMEGG